MLCILLNLKRRYEIPIRFTNKGIKFIPIRFTLAVGNVDVCRE